MRTYRCSCPRRCGRSSPEIRHTSHCPARTLHHQNSECRSHRTEVHGWLNRHRWRKEAGLYRNCSVCVILVQTHLHAHDITGGYSRQAASSEPSWQWTCPSQCCQSGMQWGGRWHMNWPKAQRLGKGGGGGACVGTGASVTEPLTMRRNIMVTNCSPYILITSY